ncbi:MAG: hypothetical protein M3R17_09180 [Bacteroidota bacterium]|nr:hypothetical protein [Bacteroidota bacterium]
MKTIPLALLILLPFISFAQLPNKSAPQRAKNKVKEIRYYDQGNNLVPVTTIYYDPKGRLEKIIRVTEGPEPETWSVETESFDSSGRIISARFNEGSGNDIVQISRKRDCSRICSWTYFGDTLSLQLDSTWETPNKLFVSQTTRVNHWKKYPCNGPKPIFWQDSICNKTIKTRQASFTFSKAGEPGDVAVASYSSSYTINCIMKDEHLIYSSINEWSSESENGIARFDGSYSLHLEFDTITESFTKFYYPNENGNFVTGDSALTYGKGFYRTTRDNRQRIKWIEESAVFDQQDTSHLGKKQLEGIYGFPQADNSLSQYYESWEYNAGDVEALTMEFYSKYYHKKTRKEIVCL